MGPHAAHTTVYIPITLALSRSPPSLSTPYQGVYNPSTLFWVNRNLLTLMQARFDVMLPDVRESQLLLEKESIALLDFLAASIDSKNNANDGAVEKIES